ncbi:MAG TPA: hydrogenase maturation protease [Desulfomonilaceae bacterium]|nr:hydrogenase maturation protease [Desulfomonilaceae bacterium]
MRTLILGMGNPILSDDGVGLFIARQLEGKIPDVDVITTAMAGLNILDLVIGYDKLFVIDAVLTDGKSLGNLKKLTENEGSLHLFSSHGLNFPELLRLGSELGYKMPDVVAIYGIDIGNEIAFGEGLSPELRRKMTSVVDEILQDIKSSLALQ